MLLDSVGWFLPLVVSDNEKNTNKLIDMEEGSLFCFSAEREREREHCRRGDKLHKSTPYFRQEKGRTCPQTGRARLQITQLLPFTHHDSLTPGGDYGAEKNKRGAFGITEPLCEVLP